MDTVLALKNVKKTYKDFSLKEISFQLEKGYIMGFIGPNGAGKSTTIKLIMNLIKKESGNIGLFGMDHQKEAIKVKQRIGFVYDDCYFYEQLTPEQMEKIIAPFYKKWNHSFFKQLLQRFRIPPKKLLKDLSKGMKMKFSLAVALAHDPDLLIMDEPTSGLDPIFRSELLEILQEFIQNENKSVFFSTHITTDLDKIADYITFINEGEIVFSRAKDDIFENYAVIKGSKELLDGDIKKLFVGIKENEFGFEGLTNHVQEAHKIFKEHAMIERPSLEDIMLYHVRRSICA